MGLYSAIQEQILSVIEIFLYVIPISIVYKILQVHKTKISPPTSNTQSHKQTEIHETLKQNQTQNVAVIEKEELSKFYFQAPQRLLQTQSIL